MQREKGEEVAFSPTFGSQLAFAFVFPSSLASRPLQRIFPTPIPQSPFPIPQPINFPRSVVLVSRGARHSLNHPRISHFSP